ncbi:TPA: hypothetical protein ACH3X1_012029 [Trebouxia sp. C0004]
MQMALHEAWGMPGPVAAETNSVVPADCPEDLWINYRKLQHCKSSGRASWWPEWEFLLYKVGDPFHGGICDEAGIKIRHKVCGGEYGCSDFSQTPLASTAVRRLE